MSGEFTHWPPLVADGMSLWRSATGELHTERTHWFIVSLRRPAGSDDAVRWDQSFGAIAIAGG